MPTRSASTRCLAAAAWFGLVLWLLNACAAVSTVAKPTATASPWPSPAITATSQPAATRTREPTDAPVPSPTAVVAACPLPTVIAPPTPAATVAFSALDPATGLHVTGRPQIIDIASYRLAVTGKVDRPLQLTYDEIRCLPKTQSQAPLICVGVFEDVATWSGATLESVLALAGVQAGAKEIRLVSADEYTVAIPLEAAREAQNLLAYEVNGQTLPVLHGFPLRAVFPDLTGNKWLKWLIEISVS